MVTIKRMGEVCATIQTGDALVIFQTYKAIKEVNAGRAEGFAFGVVFGLRHGLTTTIVPHVISLF